MAQARQRPYSKKLESIFSQWFFQGKEIREGLAQLPQTPQFKAFLGEGWPATNPIRSQIPPIYLVQVIALEVLNQRPEWLVCDGVVPLLWFFKNNPGPKGMNSRLYVHQEILPFVPRDWRKSVSPYRIVSVRPQFEPVHELNTVILTGLMSDVYCSLENLEKLLEKAKKIIAGHKIKNLKIKTVLPLKYFSHSTDLGQVYHIEYMKRIIDAFGKRIEPMSFSQFMAYDKFSSALVFDMNDLHFLGLSFLLNFALSKGAVNGHHYRRSSVLPKNFRPLSPYHGLVLSGAKDRNGKGLLDLGELYAAAESFHEKVFMVMNSSANLNLPWPHWFSEWVRATDSLKHF